MRKTLNKKHALGTLLGLSVFSSYAFAADVVLLPGYEKCGYTASNTFRNCHEAGVYIWFVPPLPETCVQQVSPFLEAWIKQSRADARGGADPMSPDVRKYFDGYYDAALLDSVRYRVGKSGVFNLSGVTLGTGKAGAQTLMDTITFLDYDQSRRDILLWAHELGHIKQYHDWGVGKFAKRYLRDPWPVERDACNAANDFLTWYKANHIDAPLSMSFGTHALKETITLKANLKNASIRDMPITGWSLTGAGADSFSYTHNCGSTFHVGYGCGISVTFTSKELSPKEAKLIIKTADELNLTITIPLQGNMYPAINDTGITRCGDAASNDADCPVDGYPQQDAEKGRDKTRNNDSNGRAGFNFSKLDSNGKVLSATATAWNCVRDNLTGLVWERKPIPDGIISNQGLHDADDTYSWYSTDANNNHGNPGSANPNPANTCYGYDSANSGSYCNTEAFVNRVNAAGWCGFTDYRMPTVNELLSLMDMTYNHWDNPTGSGLDTNYFPDARFGMGTGATLWSSNRLAHNSPFLLNDSWAFTFDAGYQNPLAIVGYASLHIRLVRSGL